MENYTLWKNKPEVFKCNINIEGAETSESVVRLCLEFSDNKNLFFNGLLKENGECEIKIPSLKDIKQNEGKLTIEVIAESAYFKVHEAAVNLKNSVEVQVSNLNGFAKASSPKVKIEQVSINAEENNPYISPQSEKPSSELRSFKEFRAKHSGS